MGFWEKGLPWRFSHADLRAGKLRLGAAQMKERILDASGAYLLGLNFRSGLFLRLPSRLAGWQPNAQA
jgi:hypothetical protein